jgi:hypothetical protein
LFCIFTSPTPPCPVLCWSRSVPHACMHTAQPRVITPCFICSMCTRCMPRSAAQPPRPPRSRSGIWPNSLLGPHPTLSPTHHIKKLPPTWRPPAPIPCVVPARWLMRLLSPALVSHQHWAVMGVRVRSPGRRVCCGQTHAHQRLGFASFSVHVRTQMSTQTDTHTHKLKHHAFLLRISRPPPLLRAGDF